MPTTKKPPVAAFAVGALVAGAIILVVLNRVANPNRPRPAREEPAAVAAGHQATTVDRVRMLLLAGNRTAAADQLRPHLDQNPDDIDALIMLWEAVPPGGKSELVERIARSNKPGEVVEWLYQSARDVGDRETLAILHAWLKDNQPDDHRWACAEIEEKLGAKEYAGATALFRDRIAAAKTEEAQRLLLFALVQGMGQAGRERDAYAAVPDAHATTALRTLAQRHENQLLAESKLPATPDTLRELVAAHRKRSPADPMLWYYEGVLLQAGGEFEKAEKVYAEGDAKLTPFVGPQPRNHFPRPGEWEWDHELFRIRRVECFLQLDQPLKAYAEVGPAAYTFRQLAWLLDKGKDAGRLAQLVAAHRARFPDAPDLPVWEADVLFLRGEYAKAADALEAFRVKEGRNHPERWRVYNLLVRSHLRAGNADAARRAELDMRIAASSPVSLRAAVLAASGDAEALEELLAVESAQFRLALCYQDEDFAREIAAERHAELRERYPDPRKKPGT